MTDPLQAIQWLSQTGELDRLCNEVLAPAIAEALAASRIAELERELAEARKLAAAQADEPGPPTLAEAVEAMFKCIEASPYAVKSAELESVRAALARERGK